MLANLSQVFMFLVRKYVVYLYNSTLKSTISRLSFSLHVQNHYVCKVSVPDMRDETPSSQQDFEYPVNATQIEALI
jgi:hypothetical protein